MVQRRCAKCGGTVFTVCAVNHIDAPCDQPPKCGNCGAVDDDHPEHDVYHPTGCNWCGTMGKNPADRISGANNTVLKEPTMSMFERLFNRAVKFSPDVVAALIGVLIRKLNVLRSRVEGQAEKTE